MNLLPVFWSAESTVKGPRLGPCRLDARRSGFTECAHCSKLRAQALTYSLALLRHWNGLPSNYVALIDVDEYIVIDQPKACDTCKSLNALLKLSPPGLPRNALRPSLRVPGRRRPYARR